jgi:hypothetical protein
MTPLADDDGRRGGIAAFGAAVVVGATIALYLVIIVAQSERRWPRVALVLVLFAAALGCAVGASALRGAQARALAAAGGAGLLLSMGYLALFSVGLLLLIAGVMLVVWLARTRAERRGSSPAGSILAFVVGAVAPWGLVVLP